jgi:uncharacterized membrane protein
VTTDRMEAFSDGVFAIAITLLILEVPRIHGSTHLARELGENWRQYITYLVSFLTIGIIWVNHHAALHNIARADRTLLFINLMLLLFVSIIPYPTGLLGEHLHGKDGDVAAAIYASTLLGMGLSFFALNWHAMRNKLHHDEVGREVVRRALRRNAVGQLPYATAIVVAFFSPALSLAMCGAIAVYYIFPWGVRDSPSD